MVSRRHPVRRPRRARAHAVPFQCRRSVLARNGSAARILRIAPGHSCERVREHQLSIGAIDQIKKPVAVRLQDQAPVAQSEEHTSELQSPDHIGCRLLLQKKKSTTIIPTTPSTRAHETYSPTLT